MKRIWIFEKPSLAKSVCKLLAKPHVNKEGYIETGDGIVTWLAGHVLEQLAPAEYDEKYKTWDIDILPFVPTQWKLKVSPSKLGQYNVVRKLFKDHKFDVVVNGGDNDREGQLLVDELLEFLKYKGKTQRILLGSVSEGDIKKALQNLKNNDEFVNFKNSALGRQRADWIIGLNMTMGLTSLAKKQQNYGGLLSCGRVQTPTLALVVERDLEIENFVPQTYYALSAQFEEKNMKFWTRWIPQGKTLAELEKQERLEATGEYDDEEDADSNDSSNTPWLKNGKIIDPVKAKEIYNNIKNAGKGVVTEYIKTPAKEKQPLPNNLGDVQKKVGNKYNYTLEETLKACQSLYEKGYTTYPRSDSNYLLEVQRLEAPEILKAIMNKGIYSDLIANADTKIKTACWDDTKVVEHHALIPTLTPPDMSSLSNIEKHVYEEITKSYIALFYPECLVDKTKVEINIANERFSTSGRVVKSQGWRVVFGADDNKTQEDSLPEMEKGQTVKLTDLKNEEKQTTPPPRYTQTSLNSIMANIHRIMKDPEERKRLKGEGIGKPATRTATIETLIKRGFIRQSGKYIISTETGRTIVKVAPKAVTSPSLTAQWEKFLDSILLGKVSLEQFEEKQEKFINLLLNELRKTELPTLPTVERKMGYSSPKGKTGTTKKTSSTKSKTSTGKKCPKCKKGNLVTKKINNGANAGKTFKGCSNYPECKHTEWPK